MAFLIHAVSAAASGREIRRSRRIEGDRIAIGRDPACEIILPDLEVTLRHALLIQIGPMRLIARATAGLPFSIDGRSTQESEIDPRAGAEIRIGGFRITIGWDEGEQAISVAYERYGLLARSTETRDERRLYSLAGVLPSRRILAWSGALLVLLLFLAWPIGSYLRASHAKLTPAQMAAGYHGDRSWSAGPLSRAHAGLRNNCTACHAKAFVSIRDESCRTCHTNVHDHADPAKLRAAIAPEGLPAKLSLAVAHAFNRPEGRCIDCHTEHKGNAEMPAPAQAFCADCHADLRTKVAGTKLGNAADFGTAHPQFMPAILVDPAGPHPRFQRMSLDAHPRQQTGLKFPHGLHLSQSNGVARMAQALGQTPRGGLDCASCHQPDRTSGSFRPITMEKDCQSCHSLAFGRRDGQVRTLRHGDPAQAIAEIRDYYAAGGQPSFGTARRRPGASAPSSPGSGNRGAREAAALFQPGGACFDCHTVQNLGAVSARIAPVTLPDHHFVNAWFDHRAHVSERCSSCHAADRSKDARDVLMPGIATCRTCHVGEQGGRTTGAAHVVSTCAMCHVYHQDEHADRSAARRAHPARSLQLRPAPAVKEDGADG